MLRVCRSQGGSALMVAALADARDVAAVLLSRGADVNALHFDQLCSALYLAAGMGHKAFVALLLDADADIEAGSGVDALTALQVAAGKNHTAVVDLLVERGAGAPTILSFLHSFFYVLCSACTQIWKRRMPTVSRYYTGDSTVVLLLLLQLYVSYLSTFSSLDESHFISKK